MKSTFFASAIGALFFVQTYAVAENIKENNTDTSRASLADNEHIQRANP